MKGNALAVMLKYPEAGRVKTRLASSVGNEAALELYQSFILDILEALAGKDFCVVLAVTPGEKCSELLAWLGRDYPVLVQRGDGLGERMSHVLETLFREGYERGVLIGSDSPDLPPAIVQEAFKRLGSKDAVVGPGWDGGYYLIGFRREGFFPGVFCGVEWSTPRVLGRTVEILEQAGCGYSFLEQWRDVDTLEDLRDLYQRNVFKNFRASRVMALLNKKGRRWGVMP